MLPSIMKKVRQRKERNEAKKLIPISPSLENYEERQIAGDREKRKQFNLADVTTVYHYTKLATERKK